MIATVEQNRRVDVPRRCIPQSGKKAKARVLRKCDHETRALVTQTSSSGAPWILPPVIAGAIVLLPVTACRRQNRGRAADEAGSKPQPRQEGEAV
jgi:hypothetical protein